MQGPLAGRFHSNRPYLGLSVLGALVVISAAGGVPVIADVGGSTWALLSLGSIAVVALHRSVVGDEQADGR